MLLCSIFFSSLFTIVDNQLEAELWYAIWNIFSTILGNVQVIWATTLHFKHDDVKSNAKRRITQIAIELLSTSACCAVWMVHEVFKYISMVWYECLLLGVSVYYIYEIFHWVTDINAERIIQSAKIEKCNKECGSWKLKYIEKNHFENVVCNTK